MLLIYACVCLCVCVGVCIGLCPEINILYMRFGFQPIFPHLFYFYLLRREKSVGQADGLLVTRHNEESIVCHGSIKRCAFLLPIRDQLIQRTGLKNIAYIKCGAGEGRNKEEISYVLLTYKCIGVYISNSL